MRYQEDPDIGFDAEKCDAMPDRLVRLLQLRGDRIARRAIVYDRSLPSEIERMRQQLAGADEGTARAIRRWLAWAEEIVCSGDGRRRNGA